MTKVEVVVIRERVETVIDAVEEETGHVGVTVIEAVGHGRERGVTHEYRGRVFESRFSAEGTAHLHRRRRQGPTASSRPRRPLRSAGTESGDGLVWTTPVENVTHNRTGKALSEAEVGA